ncbi:hypothetical protein BDK51DRAFT_49921 [Blyttiomyces helicus]|uniref:Uncharacterized protein n=1 Tax=Blyttiomyces helicus TaxID=388810 RepID=A0A4P9VV28_9FUNG|nr:hypothetical protein BDK51DRAFT_49921 [Blyttiomyces helicus]|eukprot:RKO83479.1 hypothetical protein BDK51DRAFT_49921 [Blyttiomyces helicus]
MLPPKRPHPSSPTNDASPKRPPPPPGPLCRLCNTSRIYLDRAHACCPCGLRIATGVDSLSLENIESAFEEVVSAGGAWGKIERMRNLTPFCHIQVHLPCDSALVGNGGDGNEHHGFEM